MKSKLLFILFLCVFASPAVASGQFSLWLVEKRIDLKYSVPNITHRTLSEKLGSKEAGTYVLFDVRERAEYEESHLRSAHHVDPEMKANAFIETFRSLIPGKNLVFYCSVGDRSSLFVERVKKKAMKLGALGVFNLRGGIFRWYNEGHPVVDKTGETDAIHTYDEEWGKLVIRRTKQGDARK